MIKQGKQLMLAALIASAVGVSCTGCLSTRSIDARHETANPLVSYADVEDSDVIRIHTATTKTYISSPSPNYRQSEQSVLQSNPLATQTHPSSKRPLGEIAGVDLSVAQFASRSVDQTNSAVRYDGRWTSDNQTRVSGSYNIVADKERTGLGVDVSLNPRFDLNANGDVESRRGGAEIRLGQNLDKRGQKTKNPNWYLFAGADGEAVVWDVGRSSANLLNGQVTLQDSVTIGDVQAGVAFQSPAGDMTVSYIERDYHFSNGEISNSGDENFVAVTLSWRY